MTPKIIFLATLLLFSFIISSSAGVKMANEWVIKNEIINNSSQVVIEMNKDLHLGKKLIPFVSNDRALIKLILNGINAYDEKNRFDSLCLYHMTFKNHGKKLLEFDFMTELGSKPFFLVRFRENGVVKNEYLVYGPVAQTVAEIILKQNKE